MEPSTSELAELAALVDEMGGEGISPRESDPAVRYTPPTEEGGGAAPPVVDAEGDAFTFDHGKATTAPAVGSPSGRKPSIDDDALVQRFQRLSGVQLEPAEREAMLKAEAAKAEAAAAAEAAPSLDAALVAEEAEAAPAAADEEVREESGLMGFLGGLMNRSESGRVRTSSATVSAVSSGDVPVVRASAADFSGDLPAPAEEEVRTSDVELNLAEASRGPPTPPPAEEPARPRPRPPPPRPRPLRRRRRRRCPRSPAPPRARRRGSSRSGRSRRTPR